MSFPKIRSFYQMSAILQSLGEQLRQLPQLQVLPAIPGVFFISSHKCNLLLSDTVPCSVYSFSSQICHSSSISGDSISSREWNSMWVQMATSTLFPLNFGNHSSHLLFLRLFSNYLNMFLVRKFRTTVNRMKIFLLGETVRRYDLFLSR